MRVEQTAIIEVIDTNPVAHEVILACHLYRTFGHSLLRDEKLRILLLQLDRNIEATQNALVAGGIARECADCAVNGEGTCCGKRTGYKYNSILLLVNLLLGRSLPVQAQDPDSCYFLSREGCILRARHVICVNFLCPRLRKNIPYEILVQLQETSGRELTTLFFLEEYIKQKTSPVHLKPDFQLGMQSQVNKIQDTL